MMVVTVATTGWAQKSDTLFNYVHVRHMNCTIPHVYAVSAVLKFCY